MFGYNYYLHVDGPAIFGRFISAKQELKRLGSVRPLPLLFHSGGDYQKRKDSRRRPGHGHGRGGPAQPLASPEEERVQAIMGLVTLHEGEYRKWDPSWGPMATEEDELGWRRFNLPMPTPETDPLFFDPQLLCNYEAGGHRGPCSTIVRTAVEGPAQHDGRDEFIVSLPELLLVHQSTREASALYEEWQRAEVIIHRKKRGGRGSRHQW